MKHHHMNKHQFTFGLFYTIYIIYLSMFVCLFSIPIYILSLPYCVQIHIVFTLILPLTHTHTHTFIQLSNVCKPLTLMFNQMNNKLYLMLHSIFFPFHLPTQKIYLFCNNYISLLYCCDLIKTIKPFSQYTIIIDY